MRLTPAESSSVTISAFCRRKQYCTGSNSHRITFYILREEPSRAAFLGFSHRAAFLPLPLSRCSQIESTRWTGRRRRTSSVREMGTDPHLCVKGSKGVQRLALENRRRGRAADGRAELGTAACACVSSFPGHRRHRSDASFSLGGGRELCGAVTSNKSASFLDLLRRRQKGNPALGPARRRRGGA
jgi:hypothetical protein